MNKLEHLAEFREVLSNYSISERGKAVLAKTRLALMVAPTSTGRNTIIRELQKLGDYHFIVSDTTRKPRINDGLLEQNGSHYWFKTETEMLNGLRQGEYLGPAIIHNQQVSGISINELIRARDEGKIATTDMETVGVEEIMQLKPDSIALFLLPPSFEEWMRRIDARGKMAESEKKRRLESAVKELSDGLAHGYYQFIINNTIAETVVQIGQVTLQGKLEQTPQSRGRQLAQELLDKTKKYLRH